MGFSLRKLGKFTHVRQVSLSDYSKNMARMSLDTRSRVVYLHKSGFKLKDIQLCLKEEDIKVSKKSLCLLLRKYRLHGVVSDLPKRAKRRKLALQHLKLIDEAIAADDEVSNSDLRALLWQRAGVRVSLSTVQRAKRRLGLYINAFSLQYACTILFQVGFPLSHITAK